MHHERRGPPRRSWYFWRAFGVFYCNRVIFSNTCAPLANDALFLEKSGPATDIIRKLTRVEIALQKSGAGPLDCWVLAYLMKLPTSDELICVDDRSHPYTTSPTSPKSTETPN